MSTFSELSINIVNQYENSCMTGSSVKKILQQLDNLPTQERLTNQKSVIPIIYKLKCYNNENKVLTNEETKEIVNLFKVNCNTFHFIIKEIIKNFHEYDTVHSLNLIIVKLDNMSQDQQIKYTEDITKIKRTINEYGKKDTTLSTKQSKRLLKVLSDIIPSKIQSAPIPKSEIKYTYNDKPNYNAVSKPAKFDGDDQISEIVYMLLTNLNRDVLGSSLTNYVADYFVYVNILLEDHYSKYIDITEEIKRCLCNHTWQCESDTSAGGFYSEPDAIKLVHDLQTIINKYF